MSSNKSSKKKSIALILSLSMYIFSCSTDIPISTVNKNTYDVSSNKNKNSITGKVEFPLNSAFKTKATLAEVGGKATVSLIYPNDNPTNPNVTVATGLTDDNGNFTIDATNSFTPNINDLFLLEARKRIGSAGNAIMTVRTYIKWTDNGWESISYPQYAGIRINSKTTAITIIDDLNNSISASDCLNKVNIIESPATSENIGSVTTAQIDKLAEVVKSLIGLNEDPARNIIFKDGQYSILSAINPSVEILNSTKYCPACDFKYDSLIGFDLSGADLSNADFTNANISNVNFSNANLTDAKIVSSTNKTDANFSNALWTDKSLCASEAIGDCKSEFQVSNYYFYDQRTPAIAMNSSGDFVVTWYGTGSGDEFGIYAQRFNSLGVPQGGEISVNSFTTGNQLNPSVAMDSSGNFVVSWYGQGLGDSIGIYARKFNSGGSPQGTDFRVNTFTIGNQLNPSVAMDSGGNFVIAWQSGNQEAASGVLYGVYAQRYNADLSKPSSNGNEFRVNTYTTGNQSQPAVSFNPTGGFVVAWSGAGTGDDYGIYGKRYNSTGTAQGSDFNLNTFTGGIQVNPSIVTDSSGNFIVTWYGQSSLDLIGITAQRFNSTGVAQGSEILVNTFTTDNQVLPAIAIDSAGDFVISWHSKGVEGNNDYGVSAQRFNSSGIPQREEVKVNTYTTKNQQSSGVAMDSAGNFVVTWQSDGQDGSYNGIYAKRYKF